MASLVLQVRDLKKEWSVPGQMPLQVLKGLSLIMDAGESVAIIGPSGSGKSTLLSLLAGLDQPTSGEISVMGRDMAKMNEGELSVFRGHHLGIVFQQFHLMPSLSALENVALPLEISNDPAATAKSKKALEEVGLGGRLGHLPKELSGGECQRVAIARALVTRPALLLADEPSGNLDPETGQQITELLFKIAFQHKMTMLLVTHNMDLAARCDRQLVMRAGNLGPAVNSSQ
ncbi:MAG: ABC transporter ATP-binding protein [Proteobacteria bacterium]|nr:ABC transporter ATP-binding protein [Pseudomonadota bacterium]